MSKISLLLESELSIHVQNWWKEKGYCVHGEVSIFGTSLFVDHIAHTGPCNNPDHVVGIEMKKGATKSLRKQIHKLQSTHVAQEVWGAVIDTPREKSLSEWESTGLWSRAGLLVWNGESLEEIVSPKDRRDPLFSKRPVRKSNLLLVPHNREIIAGRPSGHVDNIYHTHWSVTRDFVLETLYNSDTPLCPKDFIDRDPESLRPYKKKSAAIGHILKHLVSSKGMVRLAHKEGRTSYYEPDPTFKPLEEKKELVDLSYVDLFDIDLS